MTPNQSAEASWVRDALQQTWERHSPIQFTGWSICTNTHNGIRIRLDDSNPRSYVGTIVAGKKNGMHLNFTFQQWSPICSQLRHRKNCIQSIAVHEFGHAIGLFHEQDRPDTPASCQDQYFTDPVSMNVVRNYGYLIGKYDAHSVMNYCAANGPGDGLTLSPGDILGVTTLYGSKGDFLYCVISGDRDARCCRFLSSQEKSKAAACNPGQSVPEIERLSYFQFCKAAGEPRCCDHLTRAQAKKHAPQLCPLN
ncbi:MAG: hypothetical protein JKY49_03510 [Cohaesibacteraceae bacterium]|nr:hypothetical protein [Cohaesibacteraceae bacterium]